MTDRTADKQKNRIDWIDAAKGITILLTIIGHSVSTGICGNTARGIIFSFHMPLFFILSCVTFRFSRDQSEFLKKVKKAFRHLIIPAMITFVLITVWQCMKDTGLITSTEYWTGKLYTLFFSSGVDLQFHGITVNAVGIIWFFFALFAGRTIFDYGHLVTGDDKRLSIAAVLAGCAGVLCGQYRYLPFSLDIALAVQPFFLFGYFLKNYDMNKNLIRKTLIYGFIWLGTLYMTFPDYGNRTYLELAIRRYPLFPLCYLSAIAGTMFISGISAGICKLKHLAEPLILIGKNSLYLLCVHILDRFYAGLWKVEGHQFHTALKRLIMDLAVFAVFMLIRQALQKKVPKKKQNA